MDGILSKSKILRISSKSKIFVIPSSSPPTYMSKVKTRTDVSVEESFEIFEEDKNTGNKRMRRITTIQIDKKRDDVPFYSSNRVFSSLDVKGMREFMRSTFGRSRAKNLEYMLTDVKNIATTASFTEYVQPPGHQ